MNESVAIKRPKAARADVRESFVLGAMSLVAVAVGVGLYAQFEAGFLLALLATSVGYVVLLAMHVLARRAQQVIGLEAEIARLTTLIADMQRSDAAREREAKLGELEPTGPRVRAPRPPARQEEPSPQAVDAAIGAVAILPPPPPAISIAGYPRLANDVATSPDEGHTRVFTPPPESDSAERPAATPPADEATTVTDAVADAIGAASPETAESTPPVAPSDAVTEPLPMAAIPVSSTSTPSAATDAKSGDMHEFEKMQVLIQQLAAKLNAPVNDAEADAAERSTSALSTDDDAPTPVSSETTPRRVAAVTDQAIEHSAALLRSAAGDLRRMDASARAADEGIEQVRPPRSGAPVAVAPAIMPAQVPPASPYTRLALIAEAVAADRIDVYLDPILGLDERRAKHFEVSVRLRTEDQRHLDAGDYDAIVSQNGLLPQIESAKLARTAKVAERLAARGGTGSLFASFHGETLADEGFRKTYSGLFDERSSPDDRLVLAFAQSDVRTFTRAHWQEISTMSALGLRFSLEAVTDLDIDFEQLVASGFGFIKLDAKVFLDGLPAEGGVIPASDLCGHLSGLGLALIVGRIEDEVDLAQIVEFGAVLGQGAVFGAPRPVRVDMGPAQAAA